MKKILFRADGSAEIGLGHVIRTLALAEMLKGHFYCVFAIQQPNDSLLSQIRNICNEVISLPVVPDAGDLMTELDPYLSGNEIVVLDGYKFATGYQSHIKTKGCALVSIDDIHSYHFVADIVINHGTIDPSIYSTEKYTQLMLGTKYSLLRRPFLKHLETKNAPLSSQSRSIFLCFGGSDINNLTTVYLEWLVQLQNVENINVVIGSAFRHQDLLYRLVNSSVSNNIRVHKDIDAQAMLDLISSSTVAIVPGSTVAIECASVGIGMVAGYYVDNQHDIVAMLKETGLAETVGDFCQLSKDQFLESVAKIFTVDRMEIWSNSRRFFDSNIKARFVNAFERLSMRQDLFVRKVNADDVKTLFEWANDPMVRTNAINGSAISLDSHMAWFSKKMNAKDTYMYLCLIQDKAIGQVRFDMEEGFFLIDYSLAGHMRGKGLASLMLDRAIARLLEDYNGEVRLKAIVKKENIASCKVFEKLAFSFAGVILIKGEEYLTFEKFLENEIRVGI